MQYIFWFIELKRSVEIKEYVGKQSLLHNSMQYYRRKNCAQSGNSHGQCVKTFLRETVQSFA